ncbi:MAG: hypothetical protein FIB06_06390 [Betaproteobacteria bacterium]|nr:hypothetical protein [Betaproteobacteria bacterium]
MNQLTQKNNYMVITALAISCLVVFASFLWQGNKGFNLWDEGFLWYGVQRVWLGEVPILDFMAYDPGRYYWSAVMLRFSGDSGIMSLRAAVAVFQALGLFAGLLLIASSGKPEDKYRSSFFIISAATLAMWMFPRHKLFDISISIFLIGSLTFLASNPVPRRYFITGAFVGLVAVFGRNHGVYGAVASMGAIAWLSLKNHAAPGIINGLVLWGIGVLVGFLPIALMALLIPGFAVAFWESILFLFEQKATNLPLPVPWPWTVNVVAASVGDAFRSVLIGLFFIGTLLFGGISVLWVVYRKLNQEPVPPVLVATAFLALPYAHFAFSRADVGHLAQGIFPLLVGCFVILATTRARIRLALALALCGISFWVTHGHHPGWQCFASKQCVSVEVSGSALQIDRGTARDIALLRQLSESYTPSGQGFIATPFWPGAYALLERKSPMWEIYALFPRSEAFQKKEIERIEESRLGFAIIFNMALDGRDELRYRNTHPLIYEYILNRFDKVASPNNSAYEIYKAKDVGQ